MGADEQGDGREPDFLEELRRSVTDSMKLEFDLDSPSSDGKRVRLIVTRGDVELKLVAEISKDTLVLKNDQIGDIVTIASNYNEIFILVTRESFDGKDTRHNAALFQGDERAVGDQVRLKWEDVDTIVLDISRPSEPKPYMYRVGLSFN